MQLAALQSHHRSEGAGLLEDSPTNGFSKRSWYLEGVRDSQARRRSSGLKVKDCLFMGSNRYGSNMSVEFGGPWALFISVMEFSSLKFSQRFTIDLVRKNEIHDNSHRVCTCHLRSSPGGLSLVQGDGDVEYAISDSTQNERTAIEEKISHSKRLRTLEVRLSL